jgi:cytidylate kinase
LKPSTIAIDGPAASGKSTLGYHLAESLSYLYLDTGILYRAVTWAALKKHVSIQDEQSVTNLAKSIEIKVLTPTLDDGRQYTVLVDGVDVTWELRSSAVDASVSPVSAYAGVRHALTNRMRKIARQGSVVMVGRDIGTVVIPDADLKLYITASAEERAYRRHQERLAKGECVGYPQVLENIQQRDTIDSSRQTAPLTAAIDAKIIDTTNRTIQQTYLEAIRIITEMEPDNQKLVSIENHNIEEGME